MERIAIYPGTFDPLTLGHEDIVKRSALLFDKLIVAVAVAHHKKTLFSLDERIGLAEAVFSKNPEVEVLPFDGLVVHFAQKVRAHVMVRGLRGTVDFDYEMQLANMNRSLALNHAVSEHAAMIDTLFLPAANEVQAISSTLVKEIAKLGGAYQGFVSSQVAQALQMKLLTK